jgi:quercetin dioxygenase-like cupin family protein
MSVFDQLQALGIDGHPFFVGDGFAKVFYIPADRRIGQHSHKVGHTGMLILGSVRLKVNDSVVEHTAPATIYLDAHVAHEIESITPSLWACVWPNADGALTEPDFDKMVIE